MTDRRIDSTELDQPVVTSDVIINGENVEDRLEDLDTALGTAGLNHFTGMSSPLSSGAGTTVKSLMNQLVSLVNTTKATSDQLAAALAAIIENPSNAQAYQNTPATDTDKIWASAFTKLYVDYRTEDAEAPVSDPGDGDRIAVDGRQYSTKKGFSQRRIEEMIKTRFDAGLNTIETYINNNL
jgi:hypothetical protein